MKYAALLVTLWSLSLLSAFGEDNAGRVKKVVERSTLVQQGAEPFHLKATIAPSFERGNDSNRDGSVEVWWVSAEKWRRELTAPGLHMLEIENGGKHLQQVEGDYLPEWLREIAVALVQPVPELDKTLANIRTAEVKKILGGTHYSWMEFSANGATRKAMGAGLMISDNSNLLSYGSGFGWGYAGENFTSFHKKMIARKVTNGSLGPEVAATVTVLEDLDATRQDLFNTTQAGTSVPLKTSLLDEATLRNSLEPMAAPVWPALKDGPLTGAFTTEVLLDREGKVRETGSFVSDNPGLGEAAFRYIRSMRFRPYMENGVPMQVLSRLTFAFETKRPEGVESFDSARVFFERARRLSTPAGGANTQPYLLKATFSAGTAKGAVQGTYADTWLSETAWCREARMEASRFTRCRSGERWYSFAEGEDAGVLQLILKAIEPVPAMDTFVESDWRTTRETVDARSLVRVATGHESDDGKLDAASRGLWFDSDGTMQRAHFRGFDAEYLQPADFNGANVARRIDVRRNGGLAIRIEVTSIESAQGLTANQFKLNGHEWKRQFTDEAR